MKFISVLTLFLILGACTTANCKYSRSVQTEEKKGAAAQAGTPVPEPEKASVRVYKYEGSKQCALKSGTSLEEMEKQLKGIAVISKERKQDGKMRIQMCGADSGWANVYEISEKDKAAAFKKGFKEWTF